MIRPPSTVPATPAPVEFEAELLEAWIADSVGKKGEAALRAAGIPFVGLKLQVLPLT